VNNPYWPPELASHAGSLLHERYITLLPLMLSRTQDDKGRVIWTFFGNSIHEPEHAFWKSFFTSPGKRYLKLNQYLSLPVFYLKLMAKNLLMENLFIMRDSG